MKKKQKCYIYTRVSTAVQVDGYSLDAQRDKLTKYAEYQDMEVVKEFSDAGHSGKNINGRPEFLRMLEDIANGEDGVDFVLVFKLSRFGRNAADVLNSLQLMQDYGVNLICVEDGIDSSKEAGKLMISVLSAVAEIERENILVQTMEGRRQKAREGRWNGGFAPYGYELVNGELHIAEDEAEIIRIIFDKYIHTNMGVNGVADYLNTHGFKKKKRQNNTLDAFAGSFVKGVLDNPIYMGKMPYGRRSNEKIQGTRNEYHIVKQDEYHGSMYSNVNRKKKADGTYYKDFFYYACKHRLKVDGHNCGYHHQWGQDKVNAAVEEVIYKLVNNPKFQEALKAKVGAKTDTDELEKEREICRTRLCQTIGAKNKLAEQMDALDVSDKFYDRKYEDMQDRMDKLYEEIGAIEDEIDTISMRIDNINKKLLSKDSIYRILKSFDIIYSEFTDAEKKRIKFRFPVYYNGTETQEVDLSDSSWDYQRSLETVVLLNNKFAKAKDFVQIGIDAEDYYRIRLM